jgi:hypothetical protein
MDAEVYKSNQEEQAKRFVDSIERLIEKKIRYTNCDGIIVDVNKDKFTCSLTIQNNTYTNVPLKVSVFDNSSSNQFSFIEIPAKNSNCIVSFRNNSNDRPHIISIETCQEILIQIGKSILSIKNGVFSFNSGNNKGMVLLEKNIQRLNNIEKDLNNLKAAFKSWAPVPNDGGAALKSNTATWSNSSLSLTQNSDIENTKIIQ